MDSFKKKSSRVKHLNTVQTVHELHTDELDKINKKHHDLPEKQKKLTLLKSELKKLESKPKNSKIISSIATLKDQIQTLEKEVLQVENNADILQYMSKVADIVVNYYDLTCGVYYNMSEDVDSVQKSNDIVDLTQIKKKDFIKKDTDKDQMTKELKELTELSQKSRKRKKDVRKRKIIPTTNSSKSILRYLTPITTTSSNPVEKQDNTINRASLQEKYLILTNKNHNFDKTKINKVVICQACDLNLEKTLIQLEGCYVCKNCGDFEYVSTENEFQNHKEITTEKQKYPYKKINHLKEKLNQFQSKESADIPDKICSIIRTDLRRAKIRQSECLPRDITKILKKHRLTSYYEHLQQIYCKISGSTPITLQREVEETIINMFQSMQESFRKHCPATRSNFLSYSYVLNKCFRILNMPEHAKYFNLLKSKDKLREQDIIWNKICRDMGWDFHSSF